MSTTLTRPAPITERRSQLPSAVALAPSVDAVRDALAHMDDGSVLAVPIGTPHQNFDIVEWCAAHGQDVINRFEPWPLTELLVRVDARKAILGF